MSTTLARLFSTPARQAMGWTALGLLGIVCAAGGVWFLTGDGNSTAAAIVDATSTPAGRATATAPAPATPTGTPTPTPTAEASPTATASPSATVLPTRPSAAGGGAATAPAVAATPEPTPTEAAPVIAAPGGSYCPSVSAGTSPPNSVIGLFTVGGNPAPAGSVVAIAFDGVPGPARATTAAGGYRVDYSAAGSECANRVGSALSVVYEGIQYPTGSRVGENPGGPVVFALAIP